MVRQDLVPESKIIEGNVVTIRCAHGDTVFYPIAQLQLEVDGIPVCVEARDEAILLFFSPIFLSSNSFIFNLFFLIFCLKFMCFAQW